ncbi:MAG TPA: metal-dependent hydrolase [Vicinamibacterales bacterium]|nr:metal-dependent hydrolase [Vicinamibacterales bacterium]
MPSPIGHMVAGLAVGWAAHALEAARSQPGDPAGAAPWRLASAGSIPVAFCALLAAAPDADILMASHRTYTHSVGAIALVGLAAAAGALWLRRPAVTAALVCAAAWGSHVFLDWLGHDGTPPIGLMALWPFTDRYYSSGFDLFADVSRRYWNLDEFVFGNARSIARELVVLAPLALAALWWQRRSTGPPPHPAPGL